MKRKRRNGASRTGLPDYVKTVDSRETSMLATSPAVLKAMEARRGTPIIVPDTVKVYGMRRYPVKELEDLLIDTRYQREEVTNEVNELVTVLKRGGIIPDPISVAVRKYGDGRKYIVDGQQRWWAHVDTGTPINVTEYHVHSYEEEVTLFHALNMQRRVSPEDRLRSLPGPAGDTIRRLAETDGSPLRGKVGHTPNSGMIGGMILLRGMTAMLSNTKANGGLDRIAPNFDRYFRMSPRVAEKMVDSYATLIAAVFEGRRVRSVSAVALGRILYASFLAKPTDPLPTSKQIDRLKKLDFDALTPSHSMRWLPTVAAAVQEIWPVQLVAESK
jgi:hypothetical protein